MTLRSQPKAIGKVYSRSASDLLRFAARVLLGLCCLILGLALILTLFFIPVGVPLALFGAARLVTANDPD